MLNKFLQDEDSLAVKRPQVIKGVDFDRQYEVQSRSIRVSNLVQNSDIGTATGSFDTGASVTVDVGYTDTDGGRVFVLPFVAVYTGTAAVAGNQIYPSFGTAIANAKYAIHSGFDYHGWNGTKSAFAINIENNSGTTSSLFAVARHKKISFRNETESLS